MCPCEMGGDNAFLGLHCPEPRTEAQSQAVSISSVPPHATQHGSCIGYHLHVWSFRTTGHTSASSLFPAQDLHSVSNHDWKPF